jgi:hypothetical protein
MMVWVAVILACSGPIAPSCVNVVYPETFFELPNCQTTVETALANFSNQKIYATGGCVAVKAGDSI